MAIAVRPEEATKKSSPLDINANEYYFKNLRPYMEDLLIRSKTDGELTRSITKIINTVDSKIIVNDFDAIEEDLIPTLKVLTDESYFVNGPLRRATEEEKNMVRTLRDKLNDFRLILKAEERVPKEEKPKRERLNYDASIDGGKGGNLDYQEHNMSKLNEPIPNKTIPNLDASL